jgi:hypothetical protein
LNFQICFICILCLFWISWPCKRKDLILSIHGIQPVSLRHWREDNKHVLKL